MGFNANLSSFRKHHTFLPLIVKKGYGQKYLWYGGKKQ